MSTDNLAIQYGNREGQYFTEWRFDLLKEPTPTKRGAADTSRGNGDNGHQPRGQATVPFLL